MVVEDTVEEDAAQMILGSGLRERATGVRLNLKDPIG